MTGDDVAQLQTALARLGYEPDHDGVFGEATKAAVSEWYRHAGYDAVPAFATADADIAAARQAVDDATVASEDAMAQLATAEEGPSALDRAEAEAAVNQAQRSLDAARAQRISDVSLGEEAYNAAIRERDRVAADPDRGPSELDAAEFQIDEAAAQLDATRRATADAVTSAEEALVLVVMARDALVAPPDLTELQQRVDAATATRTQSEAALSAVIAQNGPTVPLGEAVFLPPLPARVRSSGTTAPEDLVAGDTGAEAPALVGLASGRLVVAAAVRPADIGLLRAGTAVRLLDETTTHEYSATITSIADDPISGSDGQLGYPAVITPDDPLPDQLVGVNVRVTITAASTEDESLVVPLAAVSSTADGTTRVSLVDSANDPTPIDVDVEAGLSADGFVAITPVDPAALDAGSLVVVGR
jgi:peptidoglycan hydrolase-like protein with peptidoglycan-binding domain